MKRFLLFLILFFILCIFLVLFRAKSPSPIHHIPKFPDPGTPTSGSSSNPLEYYPKDAGLSYSYPIVIQRKEVKHIRAYVNIDVPESKVRDSLNKFLQVLPYYYEPGDSFVVYPENLIIYKYIKVSLI